MNSSRFWNHMGTASGTECARQGNTAYCTDFWILLTDDLHSTNLSIQTFIYDVLVFRCAAVNRIECFPRMSSSSSPYTYASMPFREGSFPPITVPLNCTYLSDDWTVLQ